MTTPAESTTPVKSTTSTSTTSTTTTTTTPSEPAQSCMVPDHNGPLGEGWEANNQYSESIDLSRRTNPEVRNGELDPLEFGEWTQFATCLKNVLHLVEGQAYFKETPMVTIKGRNGHLEPDQKPISENGEISEGDEILAGGVIGGSNYAAGNARRLFETVKDDEDDAGRFFHGAGLRFIEKPDGNALVNRCQKFLPDHVKSDPNLQPMAIEVLNYYFFNFREIFVKQI